MSNHDTKSNKENLAQETEFYIPKSIYSNTERLQAYEEKKLIEKDIDMWVLKSAAKTAAVWGASSIALSLMLHHRIGPSSITSRYNTIHLPYKVLLPVVVITAAFFTRADNAAMEADRSFAMRYAINRDAFDKADTIRRKEQEKPFDFTQEGIRTGFLRNKSAIIAAIWTTAVCSTLLWNFKRKDINFSQKLINMRMTGQSAALIGLGCVVFVESLGDVEEDGHPFTDATIDAIINQKKGF